MNQQVATKGIQLVTISRPTAYGEYAPYTFIESEKEFEDLVQKMAVEGWQILCYPLFFYGCLLPVFIRQHMIHLSYSSPLAGVEFG